MCKTIQHFRPFFKNKGLLRSIPIILKTPVSLTLSSETGALRTLVTLEENILLWIHLCRIVFLHLIIQNYSPKLDMIICTPAWSISLCFSSVILDVTLWFAGKTIGYLKCVNLLSLKFWYGLWLFSSHQRMLKS